MLRRGLRHVSWTLTALAGAARCVACDAVLDRARPGFCESCAVPSEPALRQLNGLWVFAGAGFDPTLREAIHRLKYLGQADVVEGLATWWLGRLGRAVESLHASPPLPSSTRSVAPEQIPRENAAAPARPTRLVPVPLHPTRLVERGYNQAALLARALGPRLGLGISFYLERIRATEAQAGLGKSARAANIEAAFEAAVARAHSRVILVDDVATTGATLGAAAQALRNQGIGCVGALVLALSGS